ncbi:hypothetical protein CFOUR_00030 [Corynebacterium fournieri]|nr:hypothetical protein CFOUR_00030 [Corynebacterium fournieri]
MVEELQPKTAGPAPAVFPVKLAAMTDLSQLLDAAKRPQVVQEITSLVDDTVSRQSGLTGMALKSAVAAGKKADADAVSKGVNKFLPQIVEELNPHWSAYQESGEQGFGQFLAGREDDVVKSMLDAGDKQADSMPGPVKKVYSTLRGKAAKIVGPSLPQLGEIVERFA